MIFELRNILIRSDTFLSSTENLIKLICVFAFLSVLDTKLVSCSVKLIEPALLSNKEIIRSTVYFSEISKSGKILLIEYFTAPCALETFSQIKEEMNLIFSKSMEELHIDMAAGSQVTIISDTGGQASSNPSII